MPDGMIETMTRRLVLATAMLALAATLGCADRTGELQTGPTMRPGNALLDVVGAGGAVGCAPRPTISRRAVTAGTGMDRNSNGFVCDERLGAAGQEQVLTTDDVVMPAPPNAP